MDKFGGCSHGSQGAMPWQLGPRPNYNIPEVFGVHYASRITFRGHDPFVHAQRKRQLVSHWKVQGGEVRVERPLLDGGVPDYCVWGCLLDHGIEVRQTEKLGVHVLSRYTSKMCQLSFSVRKRKMLNSRGCLWR